MLVPPAPGVLCADGLLEADVRAAFSQTVGSAAEADAVYAALEHEARSWLEREAVPAANRRMSRVALMCYDGQGGELAVPWDGTLAETEASFAAARLSLYGFVLTAPVRLVTVRVEARGLLPPLARPSLPPAKGGAARQALARALIPLDTTREPRFRHDPAYALAPLPTLAVAAELPTFDGAVRGFAQTELLRGQNHYVSARRAAARLAFSV